MISKFATPFYPAYVWRGNLNFLRDRIYFALKNLVLWAEQCTHLTPGVACAM
jgi:hypothetical protein